MSLGIHGRTGRTRRVGVMLPVPQNDHFLSALQQRLQELGWGAGSIAFEVRRAAGTVHELDAFAAELASLGLDVLVTASTRAAAALAHANRTTPVVFLGTFDPVAAGLVASLERPGGNVTGVAGFQAGIAREWVDTLREMAPRITRVAILFNPASVSAQAVAGWRTAAALAAPVEDLPVNDVGGMADAIGSVAGDGRAGVIVLPHTFPFANRAAVVAAMARYRVPAIYGIAEMVRSGGLVSWGQDLMDQWRSAATYVDAILQGVSPGELPVRFSARRVLAVNTVAARALGLPMPPSLLQRADEVIRGP